MAAKHGFDRGELERVFGRIRSSAKIVELMDRQAKRKSWRVYRALFVNREKITHGFRFWRNNAAKLACLVGGNAVGTRLLVAVESAARADDVQRLFALTTQATDWFVDHGFAQTSVDALPVDRKALYNYRRNSHVLTKDLTR